MLNDLSRFGSRPIDSQMLRSSDVRQRGATAILLLSVTACAPTSSPACHGAQSCATCTQSGSCVFCFETNQCIDADSFCPGDIARRPEQCTAAREDTAADEPDAAAD